MHERAPLVGLMAHRSIKILKGFVNVFSRDVRAHMNSHWQTPITQCESVNSG